MRDKIHQDLQRLQWLAQLPPPVRQLVRKARQERRPCLLCRGAFYAIGIFMPTDPPQWGITPGMEAACVYALCKTCVTLPDKTDQAEAVLWTHHTEDLHRAARRKKGWRCERLTLADQSGRHPARGARRCGRLCAPWNVRESPLRGPPRRARRGPRGAPWPGAAAWAAAARVGGRLEAARRVAWPAPGLLPVRAV
jgi:hypothetical protein